MKGGYESSAFAEFRRTAVQSLPAGLPSWCARYQDTLQRAKSALENDPEAQAALFEITTNLFISTIGMLSEAPKGRFAETAHVWEKLFSSEPFQSGLFDRVSGFGAPPTAETLFKIAGPHPLCLRCGHDSHAAAECRAEYSVDNKHLLMPRRNRYNRRSASPVYRRRSLSPRDRRRTPTPDRRDRRDKPYGKNNKYRK